MERSVIDQSTLILDVVCYFEDFNLSGPTARTMEETDDYRPMWDYQWLLADHLSGDEELVGTWRGMTWVGVKAA